MKPGPLWLGACAIAGLVAGAAWPPPPVHLEHDPAESWTLPAPATLTRLDEQAFSAAVRKAHWAGDAAGQGKTAQAWRLAGITRSAAPVALISVGKGLAQGDILRVAPGQALPDGGRLADITGDRVTVELDGCRSVYQLLRPQPVSTHGTCPETPEAPPPAPRKSR